MVGYYLGIFLGGALGILFIRWLTAYRLIMTLLCLAGAALCAVAGVFLVYPLDAYIPAGAGAFLGATGWLIAWLRLLRQDRAAAQRSVSA